MSLALWQESTSQQFLGKTAFLWDDDKTVSFSAFNNLVGSLAGGLVDSDIGFGDRVGIVAGSHMPFAATLFAAWRVGAIAVPINPQLSALEIRDQLLQTEPKVLVVDPGRSWSLVAEALQGSGSLAPTVVEVGKNLSEVVTASSIDIQSDATIFFTSGTSGTPKGVTHTHKSWLTQISILSEQYGITSKDVTLSALPMSSLSVALMGPVLAACIGATCRILPRYSIEDVVTSIVEDGATVLASVPLIWYDLAALFEKEVNQRDLSSLTRAFCGGARFDEAIRKKVHSVSGISIIGTYGLTEAPCIACGELIGQDHVEGTVGYPLPHIEITIRDDDNAPMVAGAVGEICLSAMEGGPYAGMYEPLRCYWGSEEQTEDVLRGGVLHTGDVGFVDPDGLVHLVGRSKSLIIRGGANIYPQELEKLLFADERVIDCVVVGLAHPRYGEVPFAFAECLDGVTTEELLNVVNDQVVPYKRLVGIRLISKLPRNSMGKIVIHELLEQFPPEYLAD
jgi:long-chain acyl-CoA synthetase